MINIVYWNNVKYFTGNYIIYTMGYRNWNTDKDIAINNPQIYISKDKQNEPQNNE
jgi:hypothetical protein